MILAISQVLVFHLGEYYGNCAPSLEVYLIVILQLTTLSLLFSLSSSSVAVLPAMLPSTEASDATTTAIVAIDQVEKDYGPISDSKNVKRYVEDRFADTPILISIAKCESQNRQYDKNGDVLRGIQNNLDVGVMQINEKYHLKESQKLGFDIYTIEGNTAYAKYLYDREGAKPWMSSSACWAKFNQKEIAKR